MVKIARLGLAVSALMLSASGASAAQLLYYGELTGGQSKLDVPCNGHPNCKQSNFGGRAAYGYEFTKTFALEGGAHYIGPVIHKVFEGNVAAGAETFAYGFSLSGAANWNAVGRLNLHGRLGLAWHVVKTTFTTTTGKSVSGTEDALRLEPIYGIGASMEVLPLTTVGLSYDMSKIKFVDSKLNASILGVTARYHF